MFDGRLDNRDELLKELGFPGSSHFQTPDGDLVCAAYERWEGDAVPRLLGDFSWVVWNKRTRQLLLARDHSFHRALFFSRGPGFVAFATDYGPLLALPQVSRELDDIAAADFLLTCPDESERSFFKAISWVIAAGRVSIDADGVRQERVWEPASRPTLNLRRDEDYIEAAREVFDKAVACRLRVAGTIVSSVSGGLDSSAVAATAARQRMPAEVIGLSVVPSSGNTLFNPARQYGDDRPYVEALEDLHPNLPVEYLSSTVPEEFELNPEFLFALAGTPFRSPSNVGWFLRMYRRAVDLGATTVLVGDLGNVTFSPLGLDRLAMLRQSGAWVTLARELARLWRTQSGLRKDLVTQQLASLLPAGLVGKLRQWRHGDEPHWLRRTMANPDFIRETGVAERYEEHAVRLLEPEGLSGRAKAARYIVLRSRMQVEQLGALRKLTGITNSDPFSDRRVLDFCLSLPDDQFLRGGQTRSLARRAFADRLPPQIRDNPLRGAQDTDWHRRIIPQRDRLVQELKDLERSVLAGRILDLPRMARVFKQWPKDPTEDVSQARRHQVALMRGLHLGQYLRWIEGCNSSIGQGLP